MATIIKPKEAYIAIGVFAMIEQMIADLKAAAHDEDPGVQFDEICTTLVRALKAFFTGTIQTWDSVDPDKPVITTNPPEAPGNADLPNVLDKLALLEKLGVKFPDIVKDKFVAVQATWNLLPRAQQIKLIDYAFDSVEGLFLDKPVICQAFKAARFALGVPDDDPSIGT